MVVDNALNTTDSRPIQGFKRPTSRFAYALAAYIRDATNNGVEMVDILLSIARNDVFQEDMADDGSMMRRRVACRIPDRLGAIDRLLDRGLGKVIQELELVVDDSNTVLQSELEAMSVAELEAHLSKLDSIETTGDVVT